MILNYKNTLTLLLSIIVVVSQAREPKFKVKRGNRGSLKATSEVCSAASAISQLAFNNVNARIENGGNMWQDRGTNSSAYAVPKGAIPQTHALFAGALWMGGLSPDDQLKLAAVTFRSNGGNDFFPGPLTNDGAASTESEKCNEWDKFFTASKTQVSALRAEFTENGSVANVPTNIQNWPAHGGLGAFDNIIAPFHDEDGDGSYDPEAGDYPGYDLVGDVECRSSARFVPLFGDTTIYWVFNDKGDIHGETQAKPIGMEIRAQAFAFSSEDEVNNMTFYNYVLINQGSQTLLNTYFGQWVDADLGNSQDDYVGCDVQRGLGYCYNGDNTDEDGTNGQIGYGETPPAIGVDFFEGPFQDDDYIDSKTGERYTADTKRDSADIPFDNPLTSNYIDAHDSLGIPYKGLGIGYGDGVGNNERFGMRKFLYYTNGGGVTGDPTTGIDYYNYLNGIWKDGSNFLYGGSGHSSGGGDLSQNADFMFPGTSDIVGFGTEGNIKAEWTETTAGNQPDDRRFMQSAGPFTLTPGAVNNITVGVVYGRAKSGGALASIDALRIADDKAQQLFDNCFQILEGPDAPDITIKEYDKELILYLTNPSTSNNNINFNEDYTKVDPRATNPGLTERQKSYVFQGYKVYQLKNQDVSISDVEDLQLARLIFQCDINDTITRLINYTLDPEMKKPVPEIMVDGENNGIQHSIKVTTDQFAQGNNLLVNHKTYYFVAIAYGSNQYEEYNPVTLTGQAVQYLSSRKNGSGGSIAAQSGIPHKPRPNETINVSYGTEMAVTRVEGRGNGLNTLAISDKTRDKMFNATYGLDSITYERGGSPIKVEIIDPLKVLPGKYEINVVDENFTGGSINPHLELNDAVFEIVHTNADNVVTRDTTGAPLVVGSEIYFPEIGLGISVNQYQGRSIVAVDGAGSKAKSADILLSEMVYEDPSKAWLIPIRDQEGEVPANWILSGTYTSDVDEFNDLFQADPKDEYENIIGGGWAPFAMVAAHANGPLATSDKAYRFKQEAYVANNPNVDIILTPDTSKWTRCVVFEANATISGGGGPKKGYPRRSPSVNKMGITGTADTAIVSKEGMGWFPGYAIDIETGDRLNMAFSEDSQILSENGNDMIYNPTSNLTSASGIGNPYYAGGKHFIYVFKNVRRKTESASSMPAYDQGAFAYSRARSSFGAFREALWTSCAWVGFMRAIPMTNFLSTDLRISIRIARPYERITTDTLTFAETSLSLNDWNPKYFFEIPESYKASAFDYSDVSDEIRDEILDIISVVPNPYYSYADYETGKLDTRIKFTNLPEKVNIRIFTTDGTLVKTIQKDSELSYVDWNLKNEVNIPISSGTYIVHLDVPGVGEKVIKWFGVMRKPALQNL